MKREEFLFDSRKAYAKWIGPLFESEKACAKQNEPVFDSKKIYSISKVGAYCIRPRVPDGRLYDFCDATYKTHILMPLIQNSPNKRFGLSRYWTQKRPMQNRETLFLIRRGSMQK